MQLVFVERTKITPKFVPAPVRMLTLSIVRTVLPAGNPLDVVAVLVGVRVEVAGPVVRVGVADALETTARKLPATQPVPRLPMFTRHHW